jgi:peptidoglycan/LPS O-acetylase OafA/YrhL
MGIGIGNGLLLFLLMLLLSTAGAAILYYTVELRFRDMGRRISRSWSRKDKTSNETDRVASGDIQPEINCVTPR